VTGHRHRQHVADAAGFPCRHTDGSSNEPSLGSIENRRLAKHFEDSIVTAKVWVHIASVQLLIRRLAYS
jgi:hypothetical protein